MAADGSLTTTMKTWKKVILAIETLVLILLWVYFAENVGIGWLGRLSFCAMLGATYSLIVD